ncbi:MAG TPA: hypothetical protein VGO67_12750 [Verrucomicrobiae bacterium]
MQSAITMSMSKSSRKPKKRRAARAKQVNYNEVLTGVVELLDTARLA